MYWSISLLPKNSSFEKSFSKSLQAEIVSDNILSTKSYDNGLEESASGAAKCM